MKRFRSNMVGQELVEELNKVSQELEDLKSILKDVVSVIGKVDEEIAKKIQIFTKLGDDSNE